MFFTWSIMWDEIMNWDKAYWETNTHQEELENRKKAFIEEINNRSDIDDVQKHSILAKIQKMPLVEATNLIEKYHEGIEMISRFENAIDDFELQLKALKKSIGNAQRKANELQEERQWGSVNMSESIFW